MTEAACAQDLKRLGNHCMVTQAALVMVVAGGDKLWWRLALEYKLTRGSPGSRIKHAVCLIQLYQQETTMWCAHLEAAWPAIGHMKKGQW